MLEEMTGARSVAVAATVAVVRVADWVLGEKRCRAR